MQASLTGIHYMGLELAHLLESAQEGLHAPHHMIHLLQSSSIRHRSRHLQNGLFIASEIAALIHLLDKEPQRASQSFI